MRFDSPEFFISLFLLVLVFNAWKNFAFQQVLLICFSLFFIFSFNWLSGVLMILATVLNYLLLKNLQKNKAPDKKKLYFYLGMILNIWSLFLYKLLQDLFSQSGAIFEGFNTNKWIILGIGFYTLQFISYYLEVYKRRRPFDATFPEFMLAIVFFSKIPSGPILNYQQSTVIFKNAYSTQQSDIAYAIQRILLGLFKKIVLADRLLPYVNNGFDQHHFLNGLMAYLSPFLFTLQLYFDFSAYIDIAIGSARLLGVKLPENFQLPLRATSISEFWRRWHITLVYWLTNYIYYPVSFRYRKWRKRGVAIAVVLTFLVSALWHGLAITYFIWASCHFTYIIIENLFSRKKSKSANSYIVRFLKIIWIWHLVAFSNLFFRSKHLSDVSFIFKQLKELPFLYPDELNFKTWLINGGGDIENEFNFRLTLLLCILFLLLEKKINSLAQSERYKIAFATTLIVLIVVFGMFNTGAHFIYMQF